MKKYNVKPVPKPRMARSDSWKTGDKKRPCVARYHHFKDCLRDTDISVKDAGTVVIFAVKMPKSWSKKKKDKMLHQPHQQKPDIDNYVKALLDGLYKEDEHIYNIIPFKFWSNEDAIYIDHVEPKLWDDLIMT